MEIRLGLWYEPDNLDVNKFCFSKNLVIPTTLEESRFEAVEDFNL